MAPIAKSLWGKSRVQGGSDMIFVTVGTHTKGFDRLIKSMDELARSIDEQVVIQWGSSSYKPVFAENFQWASSGQIEQFTRDARVVVGHAGSGTIIVSLLNKKPLVLVPRLQRFNEHIDDHQLQLAKVLSDEGKAVIVLNPTVTALKEAISSAVEQKTKIEGSSQLVRYLQLRLSKWA